MAATLNEYLLLDGDLNLPALICLLSFVFCIKGWLSNESFPFGVTSLVDKRDYLQAGDAVKFQVSELQPLRSSFFTVNKI